MAQRLFDESAHDVTPISPTESAGGGAHPFGLGLRRGRQQDVGEDFLVSVLPTAEALAVYLDDSMSARAPTIVQRGIDELADELGVDDWIARGGLSGHVLARWVRQYLETTTRLHSPGYLGHQVAAPHPNGAIAGLIDGLTNNAMAIYEMGPGAATIERRIISWMLGLVGWGTGESFSDARGPDGVLTHGGSLANLSALVAARRRIDPDAWQRGNPGDLVILVPAASHYSIARAAGIMGLGQAAVEILECDGLGRIVPERISDRVAALRAQGKRILCLVANAGSTALGVFDDLAGIGAQCRALDVWFHVDGAHGASLLVSPILRERLRGIELADSVIWDAHKLLRTPTLCAALLVRDAQDLDRAFEQSGSYIFHDKDEPGFDSIHRTVECTKAALGLRLFMTLAAEGERGMADHVEGVCALATAAHRHLESDAAFECAAIPEANIVVFRLRAAGDEIQLEIRRQLIAEGYYYLSTVEFAGRRYLRAVIMNGQTRMADIEALGQRIRDIGSQLIAAGLP